MTASAIVTYRGAPGSERRANLDAVLAWLARTPEIEVVVVEQDTHPRLLPPLAHDGARVVFAYNGGPFNKAWGLNVGARASAGGVLLFGDADVIVPGGLGAAAALCADRGQLVKPYLELVDLGPDESARVRELGPAAAPGRDPAGPRNRDGIGERLVLCGGWFAIRRDAFAALGGFDERFVGWGGEDDAMTIKVERARLATYELDGEPALHLWHPRALPAAAGHSHYASNLSLLAEYADYDDETLARLFEVQRQSCGRRDKYRPAAR
ncbi:MAG TPA: galactosyltransferase-related protein [Casimicrobiaceae bacterium]|nr:galactosyltransferase-related protein [Casimicrobiaceae bacterium]